MDWPALIGAFSLLSFIKPDLEGAMLVHTVLIVHVCDAVLCRLIATHSGRSRELWTAGGLVLGIWALGILLFLPRPRPKTSARHDAVIRLPR
jgi:hypothetical protein